MFNKSEAFNPSDYTPEKKESEISSDFQILILPSILEDEDEREFSFYAGLDRSQIQNLHFIMDYLRRIPQESLGAFSAKINALLDIYDTYQRRIDGYSQSHKASELLPQLIRPGLKISSKGKVCASELEVELKKHFEQTGSSNVILSNSHISTYYSVTKALQVSNTSNEKTASFVFDNHADVLSGIRPWKGNIFRMLVEENKLDSSIFFRDFISNPTIYTQDKALSPLPNESEVGNTDQSIENCLSRALNDCHNRGVTRVIFSIDVDVLRLAEIGYTAMEYSPMSQLGFVADFNLYEYRAPNRPEDLKDKRYAHFILQHLFEEDKFFVDLGHRMRRNNTLRDNLEESAFNPLGVHLSELGKAIEILFTEAKKRGIKIGIKLQGGGSYLGDIVEISGYDYESRTTRAVSALLKRIESISSKNSIS